MRMLMLSALSLLFFSACKKTYVTQQVDQAFSAVYTVQSTDWASNNSGLSYTATLPVNELDAVINASGAVLVYLSFDGGTTYEEVPEVFDGIAYGAIHTTGFVYVDLHAISGGTVTPPTAAIQAKVVLIDAQPLD